MKNYDYEMGRLDGVKYALENAGRSGIKNEGRYSDAYLTPSRRPISIISIAHNIYSPLLFLLSFSYYTLLSSRQSATNSSANAIIPSTPFSTPSHHARPQLSLLCIKSLNKFLAILVIFASQLS